MPRIRTIKPEFFSSPGHRGTSPWARLLYQAMWCWADDYGRGTANVRELAAFAFPDEDDELAPTVTELPCLLKEVQNAYSVVFYKVDGRRYYAITSWEKHHKPERRAAAKHPEPEAGEPYDPGPLDQQKQPPRGSEPTSSGQAHGASVSPHGGSGSVLNVSTRDQGPSAPTERPRRGANRSSQPVLDEPPPDDEHAVGTYEPDAPEHRAELAVVPSRPPAPAGPVALPAGPRTPPERAKDLATVYYEGVKKRTKYIAVVKIVEKFLDDEWSDECLRSALWRLVVCKRELTANSLRAELNGPPKSQYAKPTASERAARTLAVS